MYSSRGIISSLIGLSLIRQSANPLIPQSINYKTTLPMRKGLSSSAAVCVLIVKCFNETYGLGMTQAGDDTLPFCYLQPSTYKRTKLTMKPIAFLLPTHLLYRRYT